MESESFSVLLVTANVGSVFEDPSRLLKSWIKEFLTKIVLSKPDFLALHLQEVGGKTYDKSMEYVQEFIKNLCEAEELADYNRIRIFLDEDYNSAEHFTALGNLYFAHKSINTVKIWNFLTHDWEMADEKTIHTGNIEAVATKEKAKFPQHFFPECKWSRKGFLRTRWELNGTILDFVNIHLFHDASNLAACEEFPSVYCKTRRRALVHTLERFHKDTRNGLAPYFVFGDFNFRCDTEGVIKKLTEDLTAHRVQSTKSDNTKVQYRNSDGHNVLTVGKKEFTHADHQTKFKESWLQQFDRELEPLREVLVEYPITFPPSYPYEEDPDMPNNYMSTRCPAWCDRIVMSPSARELILDEVFSSSDYNVVGDEICMGDHKPVFLSVHVKALQGILRSSCCCEHDNRPSYLIDLERTNKKLSASFANNCLYSSNEFYKILLECRKLDNSVVAKKSKFIHNNTNDNDNNSEKITRRNSIELNSNQTYSEQLQPLISINVTDAENANVCMCSQYSNRKRSMSLVYIDEDSTNYNNADTNDNDVDTDGSICPECRNIIKRQPTEHRCTLISKRLQLANNIIVNRIDMHYLTTYTDTRQEPYTPESAESHSPYPELSEEFNSQNDLSLVNNKTNCPMQLFNSSDSHVASVKTPNQSSSAKDGILSPSNLRGVVSPRQLKTRLENLQRASLNSDLDESDEKIIFKSKKNFKKRCCTIL